MSHTISTALRRCAELKGQIARYKQHLAQSVAWTEPNEPPFQFHAVLVKLKEAKKELVLLKSQVASANAKTMVNGLSLQQLVFELSEIKDQITLLENLAAGPKNEVIREEKEWDYTDPEKRLQVLKLVKSHFIYTTAQKEEELEALRAQAARINNILERYNHTTEL